MPRGGTNGPAGRFGWSLPLAYSPVRWLLLSGNRRAITLLLTGLILATLLAVGTLYEIEMETLVRETRAVQSLFNTLLGGIILFVSVVLSINTAALTQEFAPLRTKHVQIEESLELQAELEQYTGSEISPVDVHGFFSFVLRALRSEAEDLRDRAGSIEDPAARREVVAFVDDVAERVALIEDRLDSAGRQTEPTLLAGVDWNPAHDIYLARRLSAEHGAALDPPHEETLSNVVEVLTAFASGREYFNSLHFKRELRSLSRDLLLLSLPVIVFTAYVLIAVDAGLFPTTTVLGIQPRLLYVSVAFVVALSPYVLLSSYMLRIVAVSRYTLGSSGFAVAAADEGRRP